MTPYERRKSLKISSKGHHWAFKFTLFSCSTIFLKNRWQSIYREWRHELLLTQYELWQFVLLAPQWAEIPADMQMNSSNIGIVELFIALWYRSLNWNSFLLCFRHCMRNNRWTRSPIEWKIEWRWWQVQSQLNFHDLTWSSQIMFDRFSDPLRSLIFVQNYKIGEINSWLASTEDSAEG